MAMVMDAPETARDWQEEVLRLPHKIELLPVAELLATLKRLLSADPPQIVQRRANMVHAYELAQDFNPRAVLQLTVNRRADGDLALIDGQHRALAMQMLGIEYAECRVFEGMTRDQEAGLWRELQIVLSAKPLDVFHSALEEGKPVERDIDRLVREAGYEITRTHGNSTTPRRISAVVSLRRVYERGGPAAVSSVLQITNAAWPTDSRGTSADALEGLWIVLSVYSTEIDRTRLLRRMAATPIDALFRRTAGLSGAFGGSGKTRFAYAVVEAYNHGQKIALRLDPAKIAKYSAGSVPGQRRGKAIRKLPPKR